VVEELRLRLPRSRLILMALLPREKPDDPIRQQIAETNAALARLASADHLDFLDIGGAFLLPDGSISRELMPDLLHPSQKGYEIWAAALRRRL
jgi:beta-glucosidase